MTCNWCGEEVPDGQGAGAGTAACRNHGLVTIQGRYHMKCINEALEKLVEMNGGKPECYWDEETKSYKSR